MNEKTSFFIGFDGFIDEIIRCIDTRKNAHNFEPLNTLSQLIQRLDMARGKSANIELFSDLTKAGGNAPIFAQGLTSLSEKNIVTLVASLGTPSIHPIFLPITEKCSAVLSIANPGHTDAIEFNDGKLLLGKMQSILDINLSTLFKAISEQTLFKKMVQSTMIVLANWTMILGMNEIWQWFYEQLQKTPNNNICTKYFFCDLADPRKRTAEDLLHALHTLEKINIYIPVILSMNLSEIEQVVHVLKIDPTLKNPQMLLTSLKSALKLDSFLFHTHTHAYAIRNDEFVEMPSAYTSKPYISTGVGDTFNAGFCHAFSRGNTLQDSLYIACATAGFYVRCGTCPNSDELNRFINIWENAPDILNDIFIYKQSVIHTP